MNEGRLSRVRTPKIQDMRHALRGDIIGSFDKLPEIGKPFVIVKNKGRGEYRCVTTSHVTKVKKRTPSEVLFDTETGSRYLLTIFDPMDSEMVA